jgi:hypothetical protein
VVRSSAASTAPAIKQLQSLRSQAAAWVISTEAAMRLSNDIASRLGSSSGILNGLSHTRDVGQAGC